MRSLGFLQNLSFFFFSLDFSFFLSAVFVRVLYRIYSGYGSDLI